MDIKFAEAANYDVCVKVKDSSGTIAKKYFTVSVNAADEKPENTPDFSVNITRSGNIITIEISANGDSDSSEYAIYYKKNFDINWIRKQDYSTNTTVSVTPQTSWFFPLLGFFSGWDRLCLSFRGRVLRSWENNTTFL